MTMRTAFVAATLSLIPGAAIASIDLSFDSNATYTYSTYNAAGSPIPTHIAHTAPQTIDNGTAAYWTATTTFAEPLPGATLHISQLRADDRAVMLLNGVQVEAYGGVNPGWSNVNAGWSTFVFTPGGPETPQYFNDYQDSCTCNIYQLDITLSGPFVPGVNTLEFIDNNTNHGIYGNIVDIGPSRLAFEGMITVPEPATWMMMMVGLAGVGTLMSARRRLA